MQAAAVPNHFRRIRHVPCGAGRSGFTLLELIIAVAIIGVLAAIAVPRITAAASGADLKAEAQDTAILQRQIELYAAEHQGVYPGFASDGTSPAHTEAAFVSQLIKFSDANGRVADARSNTYRFGPYLRKGPPPLKTGIHAGKTGVKVVSGATVPKYAPAAAVGWVYNDTTGQIVPNSPTSGGGFIVGGTGNEFGTGGVDLGAE